MSTVRDAGSSRITAFRGLPSVQLPFRSMTVLMTFVQVEALDHLILFGGWRLPVYVLSSGKVTVIVEPSTMDPWATGRLKADISIVRDLNSTAIAAFRGLPSVQLPFSSIRVLIVVQSGGKPVGHTSLR